MRIAAALAVTMTLLATDYRPPAGEQPAQRRPGAVTILPGGRMIEPLGEQHATGPGPFGLAISPDGATVVSADGGPNRFSLTVFDRTDQGRWSSRSLRTGRKDTPVEEDDDWKSVFQGLAFESNREIYVSEGNSGRVRLLNVSSGKASAKFELNQGTWRDSYSGDLAYDRKRELLYVVDQANFRLAIFDTKRRRMISSVRTGRLPFAVALSPDGTRAYVTNIGMFEYQALPGADRKRAAATGLDRAAFGFPSRESAEGVRRKTASGEIDVPALGDPNVPESNSLCVIDVSDPAAPKVVKFIRTGLAFGENSFGGSSPSGVLATRDRVFVTNAHNDSVTVIDAFSLLVVGNVPIRIPGLEGLRGVLPIGMAFDAARGWLLVAEAGINAVAVIDPRRGEVLGHVPAAWFPTRVTLFGPRAYVVNAKGFGTGPNADKAGPLARSFQAELRRGAVTTFPIPRAEELASLTRRVYELNGFVAQKSNAAPIPRELRHVVVIVKENRTFDEVLGDQETAANGAVRGAPELARFGMRGVIQTDRGQLQSRLTRKYYAVAPNHHELARRFAFSDNFYADSEVSVDGHHWLVGSYPNAWTESTLMASYGGQKDFRLPPTAPGRLLFTGSNSSVHPEEQLEAGALWHHLERRGVPFRNWGEGFELAGIDEGEGLKPTGARFLTNVPMPDPLYRNTDFDYPGYNMNIPDQFRADQFIKAVKRDFLDAGRELPQFIYIHLPNDHMTKPRPGDGYPFEASYVADNDIALGRIIEFLSGTRWWRNMAIFITEDDAQGGVDHVDSHRTVLFVVSPYAKKNYLSRTNASFPAILKTAFRILGMPPLNLYDATAADLADCFGTTPDFTPYTLKPVHPDIFVPEKAKEPRDPQPGPAMDDPRVLREQHQKK